jgi:hypothetical protein
MLAEDAVIGLLCEHPSCGRERRCPLARSRSYFGAVDDRVELGIRQRVQ